MCKEREVYQEQLLALRDRYPDQEMIGLSEAASLLGVCSRTLLNDPGFPQKKLGAGRTSKRMVSLSALARWMV